MPIYEYVCTECKNKFEKMRPFSKCNEDAECPRCHKVGERIISSCITMSTDSAGISQPIGGGHSCSSCSGGSCATCGG